MKLVVILMCFLTTALADQKNYIEFEKKLSDFTKIYNAKITREPSEKFDLKNLYSEAKVLENDFNKITALDKNLQGDVIKYAVTFEQFREQGLLTDAEYKDLSKLLKKTETQIQKKLSDEIKKFPPLNARLVKKYTAAEFAEFLKSLKLPESCKMEISAINEKSFTLSLSQEKGGKIESQKGTLHFEGWPDSPAKTWFNSDKNSVETVFADTEIEAQRERANLTIMYYPDGSIQVFNFQSLDKKVPRYVVPVLGLKLGEISANPYINCSSEDSSLSHQVIIDDTSRAPKKIEDDETEMSSQEIQKSTNTISK